MMIARMIKKTIATTTPDMVPTSQFSALAVSEVEGRYSVSLTKDEVSELPDDEGIVEDSCFKSTEVVKSLETDVGEDPGSEARKE